MDTFVQCQASMLDRAAPTAAQVEEKAHTIAARLKHLLGDLPPAELNALVRQMALIELRFEGRCD